MTDNKHYCQMTDWATDSMKPIVGRVGKAKRAHRNGPRGHGAKRALPTLRGHVDMIRISETLAIRTLAWNQFASRQPPAIAIAREAG
jgi:hypothetical protein